MDPFVEAFHVWTKSRFNASTEKRSGNHTMSMPIACHPNIARWVRGGGFKYGTDSSCAWRVCRRSDRDAAKTRWAADGPVESSRVVVQVCVDLVQKLDSQVYRYV